MLSSYTLSTAGLCPYVGTNRHFYAEGKIQKLHALGTIWYENTLSFLAVSAKLTAMSSHRLKEQVVPLPHTQMRSDLPGVGSPPATCIFPSALATAHTECRVSPHLIPPPPPTPPSSPGVHIWGNPIAYPVTGHTSGTVLAPSLPACQSSAPSSCPDSLCPMPPL